MGTCPPLMRFSERANMATENFYRQERVPYTNFAEICIFKNKMFNRSPVEQKKQYNA